MEEYDIVQYWLNLQPLSNQEKIFISKSCELSQYPLANEHSDKYEKLIEEYFSLMPFSHISTNTNTIELFDCATDSIKILFNTFCDEDTLIVISNNEHNNVRELVSKQKHVYELNFLKEIVNQNFNRFEKVIKNYKKVFFYCIGTQISNGIITPQNSFIKIKQILINNNVDHVFILDDVHGMFIIPRDYSIFDYIIYTCHALVPGFDLGMCIRKNTVKNLNGFKNYIQLKNYKDILNMILNRKEKFYQFKYIMSQYFNDLFSKNIFKQSEFLTAPHIFAPKLFLPYELNKDTCLNIRSILKPYGGIRLETNISDYNNSITSDIYLRIRESNYFQKPETLIPGLNLIKEILNCLI